MTRVEPDQSAQASDPSTMLAALASRVHEWDRDGSVGGDWLDRVDADLVAAASRLDGGAQGSELLMARGRAALRDVGVPTVEGFFKLAEALQRLDEWHRILGTRTAVEARLDGFQEAALRRLMVDGRGYNPPGPFGTVVPAAGAVRDPSKACVVAQLLHATAHLPVRVPAGDPDDATASTDREVELHYVARMPRAGDPRGEVGDRPVVAVAPVLQDKADATVEIRASTGRYGVRIRYDPARLHGIVSTAVEGGAHLLFMPEMTVDAEHVPTLASAIRRAVGGWTRSRRALPQLRFVVAGLAHASGDAGNNSIVVLDAEGREILRQDKLCRWNLKWYHQRNYGIVPTCPEDAPDLVEDIPGGTRVHLADLDGLGRFLTLICADMDHDRPGDWLVRNLSVDWLHAPIMDRSIAWSRDAAGVLQPWIVARANRATENGAARVVVTNSVILTLLLNEHNGANPHLGYPVLDRCAIAFMLDRDGGTRTFRQVEATLPCAAPLIELVRWSDGFAPFPPP